MGRTSSPSSPIYDREKGAEKVSKNHTAHQEGEAKEGQADGSVHHHYGQAGVVGNCGWVPVEVAEALLWNRKCLCFNLCFNSNNIIIMSGSLSM